MPALTAETVDVAVRTDLNKSFILRVTGASTLANWQELLHPHRLGAICRWYDRAGAVTIATAYRRGKGQGTDCHQAEERRVPDTQVRHQKTVGMDKTGNRNPARHDEGGDAETNAGTADDVAVTPKKLRADCYIALRIMAISRFRPGWPG